MKITKTMYLVTLRCKLSTGKIIIDSLRMVGKSEEEVRKVVEKLNFPNAQIVSIIPYGNI